MFNGNNKISRLFELLISLPKSFYISWRLTSFKQALHLPVICRFNCKIISTRGYLSGKGRLRIGFNRTGIFDVKYQRSILNIKGKLCLEGDFTLGTNCHIEIGKNGILYIKGRVANSAGLTLCCHDRIEIGGNTVISWDTLIMDKDFHYVMDIESGVTRSNHKPIYIGRKAWVCTGCKILKGAILPDGCILSAGSVLNKAFYEQNCILTGNPANIIKKNVKRSDVECI